MNFDQNWVRWCNAAARLWFINGLNPLYVYVEGSGTKDKSKPTHAEFRMDGPDVHHFSKNEWRLSFEINILVMVDLTEKDKDLIHKICGQTIPLFADSIPVRKFGNGPDDDQSEVGCLILDVNARQPVYVTNYGQVDASQPLNMSTVNGNYYFEPRRV